mmetsp:Transcript_49131/g.158146  ORF Transcript_49131/g.158146 Transcript_49131/m.158146 type:complete len:267 (-) Transcript_49131:150-950(-)
MFRYLAVASILGVSNHGDAHGEKVDQALRRFLLKDCLVKHARSPDDADVEQRHSHREAIATPAGFQSGLPIALQVAHTSDCDIFQSAGHQTLLQMLFGSCEVLGPIPCKSHKETGSLDQLVNAAVEVAVMVRQQNALGVHAQMSTLIENVGLHCRGSRENGLGAQLQHVFVAGVSVRINGRHPTAPVRAGVDGVIHVSTERTQCARAKYLICTNTTGKGLFLPLLLGPDRAAGVRQTSAHGMKWASTPSLRRSSAASRPRIMDEGK